jgi:hypothetical protein
MGVWSHEWYIYIWYLDRRWMIWMYDVSDMFFGLILFHYFQQTFGSSFLSPKSMTYLGMEHVFGGWEVFTSLFP